MGHASKEELKYHLPQDCCGKCEHSYNNTYGDACCQMLETFVTIDYGGICDNYKNNSVISDDTSSVLEPIITPDVVVQEETLIHSTVHCTDCKHSYLSENGETPMCAVDNTIIEDVNGWCNAWEQDDGNIEYD